ncbi:hypothetical protein ABN226_18735, partial [Morganella morganii]|uniref:hypothetical protein n=1 Tax=Morganella morganii TaxID=582 RepID=UPI0032DA41AB
ASRERTIPLSSNFARYNTNFYNILNISVKNLCKTVSHIISPQKESFQKVESQLKGSHIPAQQKIWEDVNHDNSTESQRLNLCSL